ncbi:hypothetical protein FA95DRAFT_1600757 [Auriscalpium vulgare]|uniref:Uncharacterized protein n=1 Tax=Auriscalpium vulgare TaxID=40419 RepID=A0ACB8SBL4_9AGAM|nr:hypothetical protein FA95DRAFT_1600757 [Auriscalpium vulgare]
MHHRWNRNAALISSLAGACINFALTVQFFTLWRSFRWEAESEWEGSVDLWVVNSVRLVGTLSLAYVATAAVASVIGFVGIIKGIPAYIRFYRDYSVADFTFCTLTTLFVTYASFRYSSVRSGICEELSLHSDLMRELTEMGLNLENCEQVFENAVVAFVVVMTIIIAVRLHFVIAVSNYYAYITRSSSGLPTHCARAHKDGPLQRIYLLPSPTTSTPGGSPGGSAQETPVVYAPSKLTERDARGLNAREAWVPARPPARQHRHSPSRRGEGTEKYKD